MSKLKNITTGEIIEATPTQDLANQGYVPISDTSVITADSLKPVKSIDIPAMPEDTINYQGIIKSGLSYGDIFKQQQESADDLFKQYLSSSISPPSLAGQYATEYNQANIEGLGQNVISNQAAVKSAQNELELLNAQMKGLTAESEAVPIQIQQESIGRGRTAAGVAPLQTAQLRDIALRALPLQSQILVAQAKVASAQGDVATSQQTLALAQSKLDRVFQLKSQDADRLYNYNKDIRDKIWEYLTAKEKTQLEAMQKEDDRKYQESRDNLNIAQQLSQQAMQVGLADIAAQITQLNPSSNTFTSDLAKLQAKIVEKTVSQQLTAENADIINQMTLKGYIYLKPSQLTGLNESQITRIKDSTGKEMIFKNPVEEVKTPSAKKGGGTVELGGYPKGYWTAIKTSVASLQKGEKWGTVFDRLKMQFPTVSNEDLDKALGTEWRLPGAFEEFKQKQYKETQPKQFEVESGVWAWLATEEAMNMSNEQKKQEIMANGFNPDDFGVY